MTSEEFFARFPSLTPVRAAPSMFQVMGCGLTMVGRRDEDPETGTYVSHYCLTVLLLPLLFLRAYRVAPMDGGWVFFGKQPASLRAKAWNVVTLVTLACVVAAVSVNAYTGRPAYKARQQMAAADRLVAQGQVAEASAIYRGLVQAGAEESDNAATTLRVLLQQKLDGVPLQEAAGAFRDATALVNQLGTYDARVIADAAVALVEKHGMADCPGGMAVLDAVRSLVGDPQRVDSLRLTLLKQWAKDEPKNLGAVVPLAKLLADQGQAAEAKALLLPVADELGTGQGAIVLGGILANEGDVEGAYKLLWPSVAPRLKALRDAENRLASVMQTLWEQHLDDLKNDRGPEEFYRRLENATPGERDGMVEAYLHDKLQREPEFAAARQAMWEAAEIVPAALDLGIVLLHRAQGQAEERDRRDHLQRAEEVFLAVRGVAGESDEYRMYLRQVYYWLGRQQEGRRLMEEVINAKHRSCQVLLGVAMTLRDVGAEVDARELAGEAYKVARTEEERHASASVRALVYTDQDDRIAWLEKTNTGLARNKANLASARGDKAMSDCRLDDAARHYAEAVSVYRTLPRDAAGLNNMALAQLGAFGAKGDPQALAEASDHLQQAILLEPGNAILMGNAGDALMRAAVTEIVSRHMNLRGLGVGADLDQLSFLWTDAAQRKALVKELKEHPTVVRAAGYLEKATVLAPRRVEAYQTLEDYYLLIDDMAALQALRKRVESNSLETADHVKEMRLWLKGERDAQVRASYAAREKRLIALEEAGRKLDKKTAAYALAHYAEFLLTAKPDGPSEEDLTRGMALIREAHELWPSTGTRAILQHAHAVAACRRLAAWDPSFAALRKAHFRAVGDSYLLALALQQEGYRKALLADADVAAVVAMMKADLATFPELPGTYDWAVLRFADPATADEVARRLAKSERNFLSVAIAVRLQPANMMSAIRQAWLHEVQGKPTEARLSLRRIEELGFSVPPGVSR